jgi:ArsR family transcriptional regulator
MLDVAAKNLEVLDVHNVELLEGNTADLPLKADSVDAAFANMVLHHAEDPVVILAEMIRVVKPGGTVAIVDEVEHEYTWMREEHADVYLIYHGRIRDFFHEARAENCGYESLGMQ